MSTNYNFLLKNIILKIHYFLFIGIKFRNYQELQKLEKG